MVKTNAKILIIRLGAIGDVVHTTNLYRSIKKSYPQTTIHYMTTKIQSCFLENDKDIDKVIAVRKEDIKFPTSMHLAAVLKQEKYDLVINLQPSFKTRLLTLMSGIKKQLIYKKTFKEHAVKNFWLTAKSYFKDIELPDKLTLFLCEEAQNYAKTVLKDFTRPLIAFNAGGIASPRQGRTYPVEKWIELGKKIQKKYGGTIILTGAKEDEQALLELLTIPNTKSFIGKTTIEQNAAVIKECDLLISGDSGPLHIATALNTPALGLYGSMPVERTGAYGKNCISIKSNMPCVPCNRRKCKFLKGTKKIYTPCMEAISTEQVLEKCEQLINVKNKDIG